jgi:hypothetical protein
VEKIMAPPNDRKTKLKLLDVEDPSADRRYWMGKSPEERLDAVEFLREQFYVIQGYAELPRIPKKVHMIEMGP